MMKEWRAWEYLVMRTIISLERVTKDSEMKWVVTNTGGKNACIQGLHGDYIVIFQALRSAKNPWVHAEFF